MAPKIQIPDELKKDLPPNKWGKILGATPIVMTVIATMLAGLASSEMTEAQYDRASAAQLQSKAGDQWGYYQAKKLRSAVARNSLDLLAATSDVSPLTADALLGAEAATVDALVKNKIHLTLMRFNLGELDIVRNEAGQTNLFALGLALPSGLISPSFTALLSNGSAILASVNGVRPLLRRR